MVFVESVDSFVEQAEALYKANPLKARYVIKYSHCKGKLTLKVTDDRTTVQYKTDQQSDLRKVSGSESSTLSSVIIVTIALQTTSSRSNPCGVEELDIVSPLADRKAEQQVHTYDGDGRGAAR